MKAFLNAWLMPAALAFGFVAAAPGAFADATYGYAYVPPATSGTPKILKVELNSDHLRAGGPIAIRVTTSSDVVKVVTGSGKKSGELAKSGPGVFTSNSTLPRVGGLLGVKIKLHFTATNAAGQSVSVDVPVAYK